MHRQGIPTILILALAFPAGGCSTFDRDWKKPDPNAHPLGGRWSGTWTSDATGHSGALRCIVTRIEDERYHARFHARYAKIFTFESEVMLDAVPEAEYRNFKGESDLGWLAGGVYHYEGKTDGETFTSTYKSKDDHGRFEMTRPEEEHEPAAK